MATVRRARTIHKAATTCFRRATDWASFFRAMLGVNGVVRAAFPNQESLAKFGKTKEYARIQQMLTQLRAQEDILPLRESTRMITIRLPISMHEALIAEAHDHKTSMNKLCISKLLQLVDKEMVPKKAIEPDAAALSNGKPMRSGRWRPAVRPR